VPCYLFTYHAYGSWLPDHPRGYVHRGEGILPPDKHMGELYLANLKQAPVRFDRAIQRQLIEAALEASEHQNLRCHYTATELTHMHVLVSWKIERQWQVVREKLRESLSRRLNGQFQHREWFSKGRSRRHVKDRAHFDYLVNVYLPKHSGMKWCEGRGVFQ
jgi:hypothetical protein